jgi:hypothetical protein
MTTAERIVFALCAIQVGFGFGIVVALQAAGFR